MSTSRVSAQGPIHPSLGYSPSHLLGMLKTGFLILHIPLVPEMTLTF